MFEWYDFFLAATAAASVWPRIFFPSTLDPALALAVSIATVGVAQLAKPVGAVLFGHIGDKYGRRNTLVWTLVLMGFSSLGTALLPPYASIGVLSLVMLFIFRIIVGVGLAGEFGGAVSWVAEARPNSKHRGFWVSWPTAVLTLGKILSIFAFFLASSYLPTAAYLDWGWRVPFAVGAVLLAIGLIIRLKVIESPMFQQLQAKRSVLKHPTFQVVKDHWRKIFVMVWLNATCVSISGLIILPYSISYLIKLGVGEAFANLSVTGGTASAFFAILGGAYVSDYVGRLKVVRVASLLLILSLYPYFFLLNTLNPTWILLAQMLLYSVGVFPLGSNSTLLGESFATKYRYSGSGLAYQFSNFVLGILVAIVLPLFLVTYGVVGAWLPIVWVTIGLAVVSLAASFFVKETKGTVLE